MKAYIEREWAAGAESRGPVLSFSCGDCRGHMTDLHQAFPGDFQPTGLEGIEVGAGGDGGAVRDDFRPGFLGTGLWHSE